MSAPFIENPICRECGRTLPRSSYYQRRSGEGKKTTIQPCIECTRRINASAAGDRQRIRQAEKMRQKREADPAEAKRRARLVVLRRFNMTQADYDAMLERQGGLCAICRQSCSSGDSLSVDHDRSCCGWAAHLKRTCGKCNRGLLCGNCNRGIGLLGDDPKLLIVAARYLLGLES